MTNAWFSVEEIDSTTFAIGEPGHWEDVRSFLLIGKERAALIDSGTGIGEIDVVVHKLTELPITVLTTHVHWDHIGGHGSFDDIRVHQKDAEWLRSGIGIPIEKMRNDLMREPLTRTPPASFDPNSWAPPLINNPTLIEDGEIIELGSRQICAIHTPGHSPGHLCFHDLDRGYLATGDLLYEGTPIYAFFPSTDPVELAASIDKLAALTNINLLLPGHNASTSDALLLEDARIAMEKLRVAGLLHHGSGEHRVGRIQVKF